jgi:hypothetical protein
MSKKTKLDPVRQIEIEAQARFALLLESVSEKMSARLSDKTFAEGIGQDREATLRRASASLRGKAVQIRKAIAEELRDERKAG